MGHSEIGYRINAVSVHNQIVHLVAMGEGIGPNELGIGLNGKQRSDQENVKEIFHQEE
jgi:hypothetical protein